MARGYKVFSPITHSHQLAEIKDVTLPTEFEFWREWCLSFLDTWATELWICDIPGVYKSVGVAAEVALAKQLDIPIHMCGKTGRTKGEVTFWRKP